MPFCTITPTRGDRPQFLEFCKHQLSRMTLKPDHSYFIDWKPQDDGFDLVARVRDGVSQALRDGFTKVFIIEDDDYYPANYFETMKLDGCDFIGQNHTTYYNLRNKTWQEFQHPNRSSLFVTGLNLGALKDFIWPEKRERHLDIKLWMHAMTSKKKVKFVNTGAIGMKHGVGKFAGRGHTMTMKNNDLCMSQLKQMVDPDAYIFYKQLF